MHASELSATMMPVSPPALKSHKNLVSQSMQVFTVDHVLLIGPLRRTSRAPWGSIRHAHTAAAMIFVGHIALLDDARCHMLTKCVVFSEMISLG